MQSVTEVDDLPELLDRSWSAAKKVVTVGGQARTRGWELGFHSHAKAQVLLVLSGFVTSEVKAGVWLVPPGSALFIAGGLPHRLSVAGEVSSYVTLVAEGAARGLPPDCCTLAVTPLLSALIQRSAEFSLEGEATTTETYVQELLLNELAGARRGELHLPMPADKRLRSIFEGLIASPGERRTVEAWARQTGLSQRTLERTILSETGLNFSRWREQLHILLALRWMAEGRTVQQVALELGFESASSFTTMFRRVLGTSPKRYMTNRS